MAKNDFLEGIRKGLVAYMQTKQWREQMESTNLQQEMARMQMEQMQRKVNTPLPTSGQYPKEQTPVQPKPQKWVPTTEEESVRYYQRTHPEKTGKVGGGDGGGGDKGVGQGEMFLKIISNMDFPEAKKMTESTYKGFTLKIGEGGKYRIVDKNKEVDPVSADAALDTIFGKFGFERGTFPQRNLVQWKKDIMTGDPDKILELESGLFAKQILAPFLNKIKQSGNPELETALVKSVSDWYLGVGDGTIGNNPDAPQTQDELKAQIQEFLSGTSTPFAAGGPMWFRNKVLSYIGKGVNYLGEKAMGVPPAIIGAYGKGVKSAFSFNPEKAIEPIFDIPWKKSPDENKVNLPQSMYWKPKKK
jgi:hypothetical protein